MSSATSTKDLPPKGGSYEASGRGSHEASGRGGYEASGRGNYDASGRGSHQASGRSFRLQAEEQGFNVGHLFVLLSLIAATIAVVMSRPATPESLILISLTIGAAAFAAVCFYRMLAPLVAPHTDLEQEPISERLRADLEREKALTLRSIKELEFDRAMGKLSQQDFDQMSARLRARAIGIIKQLDAGTTNYRAQIEKDLAARLGAGKPDLQAGRAANRQPHACACGASNDHDARFCKSCGARLVAA